VRVFFSCLLQTLLLLLIQTLAAVRTWDQMQNYINSNNILIAQSGWVYNTCGGLQAIVNYTVTK